MELFIERDVFDRIEFVEIVGLNFDEVKGAYNSLLKETVWSREVPEEIDNLNKLGKFVSGFLFYGKREDSIIPFPVVWFCEDSLVDESHPGGKIIVGEDNGEFTIALSLNKGGGEDLLDSVLSGLPEAEGIWIATPPKDEIEWYEPIPVEE